VFFNIVDFAENTNATATDGIASYKIHTNTAPVVVDPGTPGVCTISSPTENSYVTGSTLRVVFFMPQYPATKSVLFLKTWPKKHIVF
jgi:hypothetical protein